MLGMPITKIIVEIWHVTKGHRGAKFNYLYR